MGKGLVRLIVGILLVACGLVLLRGQALISGGAPGLALICQHLLPGSMGLWLLVVNIPFVTLSWWAFGKRRTLICLSITAAVALATDLLVWAGVAVAGPAWLVAPVAGALIGAGLVLMLRQGLAISGTNLLALYLERRCGWHSATTLLAWDLVQLLISLLWYPPADVLWSALTVVSLASVLRICHRAARPARGEPLAA